MKSIASFVLGLSMASSAFAGQVPEVVIDRGGVEFSGRGCMEDNLPLISVPQLTNNESGGNLDFIFDGFEVDNFEAKTLSRSCTIFTPIKVPPGYRVKVKSVAFEGETDLMAEGNANISVRHRLAGTVGAAYSESFDLSETFEVEQSFNVAEGWDYRGCGEDFSLKTTIKIRSRNGYISIDGGALKQPALSYKFEYDHC
ncbi:DUF4360 domain-containing protein [Pseudobacteriovorax antillogorgiicola]|uniref:DUF4360 domain-containing protein n=1 Tax=Pseudobacteriovorax antillogorgiicola TaxID=1513793 RepID=A0A1Y6BDS4_9BACT|nr:DUF4360 domain-containing protein [Pseudobacteriovorax antillogorgiicola]TCS56393.1 uncharacterized protein DUF4360 [Pseudobacteriovorax antillogorgiicola]SMF06163.1 protein of unknown function [Pseudobacteriovorax antillogorgiicola]